MFFCLTRLCVVRVCLSVRVVAPPTCLWNAFHSSFPLVRISLVAVLVTVHVTAVEARTRICTYMNASQRKKCTRTLLLALLVALSLST